MHWFRSVLAIILVSVPFFLSAQPPGGEGVKQPRILILVDGSSSMLQPWKNGKNRFAMAGALVEKLIDSVYSVNNQVEFGLRVYGHRSPAQENDCYDTRREVMFSKDNLTQMSLRMASLQPRGVSPIAYSIRQAAEEDMADETEYSYSLILITDGGESCGGDICNVVKTLLEKKIFFKPYILSLVDYAPLRQQYDCLGRYLQVTKDGDIPVAVGTIVDAYRKSLILAKAADKPAKLNKPINVPSVLHIPAPAIKLPEKEKADEPPVKVLAPATTPAPAPATPAAAPPARPVVVAPVPAPIPREELQPLIPVSRLRRMPLFFATPAFKPLRIPKMPVPRPEADPTPPPVPRPRPVVPPVAATPDKPADAEYTTTTERSQESMIEVYFTDGKGKYYQTTPQLLANDARTGNLVKKFYRTVNASGTPEPQQLPPGTYNVVVAGRSNLVAKNIILGPNEKKKVYIKVSKSTLRFRYEYNKKRPVAEFEALVSKLFEPGPAIRQRCTAELEYEPANYRIEINTIPVTRLSLDIEFNTSYDVTIPEPGFVQFTNHNNLGRVILFRPLNDAFVRFLNITVSGHPADQKIQLQPGSYDAHWYVGGQEKVLRFQVRSNDVSNVELQ